MTDLCVRSTMPNSSVDQKDGFSERKVGYVPSGLTKKKSGEGSKWYAETEKNLKG